MASDLPRHITERQHAQDLLHNSEERYRRLAELSPDAILIHDGTKRLYANTAAVALVGARDPREILGNEILSLVHPDDRPNVADPYPPALRGRRSR